MPLTYEWQSLAHCLDDADDALTFHHWEEVGIDRKEVPLKVDWDELLRRESIGQFRVFGVRRDEKLVGYSSWSFFKPPRYSTTTYIQDDVFYLTPEERKGMTGYYLIAKAIAAMPRPFKLQIRQKMSYENLRGRDQALIFKRLGLAPIEVLYSGYFK